MMLEICKTGIGKNVSENRRAVLLYRFCLIAIPLCMIFAASAYSKAALFDREPNGSIKMPNNRTMEIDEGKAVKIDFGTKYDSNASQSYYFYRITASKTGYIQFTDDFTQGNCMTLCDEKKNVLSKSNSMIDDWFDCGSGLKYETFISYGVVKGKTYHIRVKGASSKNIKDGTPYIGTVKWTNTAVNATKYGKSKRKAVILKRNKLKNGLFIAGSKRPQWFKIKIDKRKKIKLFLRSKYNCGSIMAKVKYKSNGDWSSRTLTVMRSDSLWKGSYTLNCDDGKRNTCYIKVYPAYKESGMYQLRWK